MENETLEGTLSQFRRGRASEQKFQMHEGYDLGAVALAVGVLRLREKEEDWRRFASGNAGSLPPMAARIRTACRRRR